VLQRSRRAGVDDEPHVRSIDAHAERHRRDDDVGPLTDERVLIPAALRVGQSGMVGKRADSRLDQPVSQRVDLAPGRAIDDAGIAAMTGQDIEQLPLQRCPWQHAIEEVRPIERADEFDRIPERQLRRDVAPHARGCRRRVGVQADAGQQFA
jgi:hypothetical protein